VGVAAALVGTSGPAGAGETPDLDPFAGGQHVGDVGEHDDHDDDGDRERAREHGRILLPDAETADSRPGPAANTVSHPTTEEQSGLIG